jgi:dihydroxyacetone kinase-like protein
MSPEPRIQLCAFKDGFCEASAHICAARNELCALDAVAGDGDLGVTLAVGFEHVRVMLNELAAADVGEMLTGVGSQLARSAPSTIGTLMASGFLRAGEALKGVTRLESRDVVLMLEATCSGVSARGGANVGERTVLDAMNAAAVAAEEASVAGAGPEEVLVSAATAAEVGANATASMEPRHGRAVWLRDRALGNKDAGAAAWAIYLAGLAEGCRQSAT